MSCAPSSRYPGLYSPTVRGRTYRYAWRGGPRLNSAFGTPEFDREWDAVQKVRAAAETPGPSAADAVGDRARIRDLAGRGVGLTQIAALLRKPYAFVTAAIDDDKRRKGRTA